MNTKNLSHAYIISARGDEGFAKGPPADKKENHIKHKAGNGRGEGKPMLQQEGQSQLATFGDLGKGMDMIHAKGQYGATQQSNGGVFQF